MLAELDARLTAGPERQEPRRVALFGLGGVGKTSLAVEYAYRQLAEVEVCWQFPAEDQALLKTDFSKLAAQLGVQDVGDSSDPMHSVAAVHGVLARQDAGWLLVFDNAPDLASIERFLPPAGRGRVLVTTRDPYGWPGQALEVPVLNLDAATDFLMDRTGDPDRAVARELADEVGGLPLALEQAAAYILAAGSTMGQYLRLFRSQQADLLARGKPTGYHGNVAATLGMALSRLADEAPEAAGLMRVLAFLAPEPVPVSLLLNEQAAASLSPEAAGAIGPLLGNELAALDAIAALGRYSLASQAGNGLLLVHRLVQAMTRAQLTPDQASQWHQAAVILTETGISAVTEPPAGWSARAALLPHAQAILDQVDNGRRDKLSAAHLAIVSSCAVSLLLWCSGDLFQDDLRREPFLPFESVRAMIAPAARWISKDSCDDPDALLAAAALLGGAVPPGPFTVPALGFAYAQGMPVRLLPEQIQAAVRHFGGSRVSVRIVRRCLLEEQAPVSASLREDLIAVLMKDAERLPAALAVNAVLAKGEDWDRALDVLRPLASQYEPAALRLAEQLAKRGQVDEAEAVLAERAGQSEVALRRLANLLADRGRLDEAMAVLDRFGVGSGSASVLLAKLLSGAGRVGEAIAVLRPLASQEPDACVALAGLLAGQGTPHEAIGVLRPMADRYPNVALALATLLANGGADSEAVQVLRPLSGHTEVASKLADLYIQDGRPDKAIDVLRPLVKQYRPVAALRVASLYLDAGQADDAIAVLSEVAGQHAEAADRLTELLVAHDRHAEAAQALWPHTPVNRSEAFELATQLAVNGHDERAVNVLRPHAQTWDQAAIRAARLLGRRSRRKEAIAVLRPVAGTSQQACLELAQLLVASGVDNVTAELGDYSDFPAVAAFLAGHLMACGRTEDAERLLRPIAERHESAAVALADVLVALGRSDEAVSRLSPLAERNEQAATWLAAHYLEARQRTAAIAVLRPLAGQYQRPATKLAGLLAENGDIDGAIEVLRPLVGRFPEAAREIARLMDGNGRTAEAIELLSPLADRLPVAAAVAGRLLAKDGRPDEAVALLSPRTANPENALALAAILLRQGATDDAIHLLQNMPGGLRDIRAKALLGGALLLSGDRIAGLDQFNQLNQMRGPVARGYHAVCQVVADLGRDDVLGTMVNWGGGGWLMSQVAAGNLLRLLLNQPGRTSIRAVVRTIWRKDPIRGLTARELAATLQAWVDDPSTDRPPLQIVSHLEVLLCLGGGADLRVAVVKELAARAAASPATRDLFARYVAVSEVAAAISRAGQGGNAGGGSGDARERQPGCGGAPRPTGPRPGKQRPRRGKRSARGKRPARGESGEQPQDKPTSPGAS